VIEFFITFVVLGFLLLGVEVFIPGGIVGVFGALCLFVAVVIAFVQFGPSYGTLAALSLLAGGGVFMVIWLRIFPKTPMGRKLTLARSGGDFKASMDESSIYLGKEGVAQSALRPSGIALIDGKRVDVVAEAGFIGEGSAIKVILVEGNRIVVRAITRS
jgi:membrane-bound serine protease (ClpP class)